MRARSVFKKIHRAVRARRFFFARPVRQASTQGLASSYAIRAFYLMYPAVYLLRFPFEQRLSAVDPLWPQRLVPANSISLTVFILAGCAAVLWPDRRPARLAVLLSALWFVALNNSVAMISHSAHIWIFAAFWFSVWCPKPGDSPRRAGYLNLMAIGAAQAQMAAAYFCAGLWKLRGILICAFDDHCAPFAQSLSYMAAHESLSAGHPALWANVFIDRPWLNILALIGALLFQLLAPIVVAQPPLIFAFGLAAIAFHVFAYLLLGPSFSMTVLALALIYLAPRATRKDQAKPRP